MALLGLLGRQQRALRQLVAGLGAAQPSAAYPVFRTWQPSAWALLQHAGWASEAADRPAAGALDSRVLHAGPELALSISAAN